MVHDKDETSAAFISYSMDDDPIMLSSSINNNGDIDYNLHSQPPLSIYWGGCAFGSAFCKYFNSTGIYNVLYTYIDSIYVNISINFIALC